MSLATPLFGPATTLFGAPSFDVGDVPLTVTLAGVTYPVELDGYRRGGLDLLREQVVTSDQPDDQLFDSRGTWWRYRFDWRGGAGQQIVDLGPDQDETRFFASRGVDVWDRYRLRLLPASRELAELSTDDVGVMVVGDRLFYWDGTTLRFTTSLIGTPTWTTVTGLAGTIRGCTSDGLTLYVATSTNLYQLASTTSAATTVTTATAPAGGYHSVGFVGNRLLASGSHRLYEVKATTLDTILEHYQAEFRWTALFAIGSRIYAGGFAGNRSEIIILQTLSDGSLAAGPDASPPAAGEQLRAVIGYAGAAIVATSRGIRFAQLAGDATLVYGPLITEPGDVRAITVERQFAWFGWSNFPGGGVGTGRMDLTRQTELRPAFATDVYTEATTGVVHGVARFQNRTLYAVAGEGLYQCACPVMDNDFVERGWLDTGQVYFGAIERKVITELLLRHEALGDGEIVHADVVSDIGDLLAHAHSDTVGATESFTAVEGHFANWVRLHIELEGPGTTSPTLNMWRTSAFPSAPATQQWMVPLVIHQHAVINDAMGELVSYDVAAQIERLVDFWRMKRMIAYSEGGRTYRVRIDNYEIEPHKWDDEGRYFEVKMTVRLYST